LGQDLLEEVERGLRQLLADVRDRLDLEALREIEEYLHHNEFGLAAESLTYSLAQIDPPLSSGNAKGCTRSGLVWTLTRRSRRSWDGRCRALLPE
jgi:hypothetical protein